jgi:hypothetical protein
MSVILNHRESATVIAGLRLLAGDGVAFQWRGCAAKPIRSTNFVSPRMRNTFAS